ncbi:hypothetical protein Poli38472_004101 [Pythium oligandrum]|uniref:Peptidase M20 dimerisation domain-containing protein n=1 Tax=Pythium oligandrum TaxID=41045 RepID=A0A8K1CMG3_PYTOL|nr:hypothetical protein Poli38472_004101 [Pythium oligandrum]|eukprot:TMW66336.1 hypothetical protein Poli38472_004101 [Pythium oligandrum]
MAETPTPAALAAASTPDSKAKMKQGAGKRLNDKQRVEIIQLAENSKISKRQLADKYGVSEAAIRKLLLKKDEFLQRYYDTPEEIRDQRLRGKSTRLSQEFSSIAHATHASDLVRDGVTGGVGSLTSSLDTTAALFAHTKSLYPQDDPWKHGLSVLAGKVAPFMKNFAQGKQQRDVSLVDATDTDAVIVAERQDAALAAAEGATAMDLEGAVDMDQLPPSNVDWLGFARMLRDIRRAFHRYPETGYQEFRTQAFIKKFCESSLRIPGKNVRVMASTGLVVDVCYENGTISSSDKRKLPVLAFRADMDALPIEELNDHLPYCSTQKKQRKDSRKRKKRKTGSATPTKAAVDGTESTSLEVGGPEPDLVVEVPVTPASSGEIDDQDEDDSGFSSPAAHMCGHDGHMVMVLGLLALVVRQAHLLPQDTFVRFIFQPAEEAPGGAERMISEGVLQDVDEVYGLHNYPFPLYSVHVRPGPVMAHEVEFTIEIEGVGGHGSAPQNCVDPILAGAMVVQALQSIVSRTIPPTESVVVSVTQFRAGDTNNVIPAKAVLGGTIREFDLAIAERVKQRMEQIVHSTCLAVGATASVHFAESYPPVVNPYEETRLVQQVAIDTGLYVSEEDLPLMAVEDFSYFLQERKGCFFFLGTKEDSDDPKTRSLHCDHYDFNDKALPLGIRVFIGVLQSRLQCQLYNIEDLQEFQVAMERIVG